MPEGIVYFNAPSAGQWGAPALVANRWIVSWPVGGTNYSVLIHDTTTDTNSTVAIGSTVRPRRRRLKIQNGSNY